VTAAPVPSRRAFLGLAAGAAAFAPVAAVVGVAAAQTRSAAGLAAFAESLELALVDAYDAIAELVSDGLLPLVQTHRSHHEAHADAFAELAGEEATGRANAALAEALAPALEELSSQFEALDLARALEDQVAATYAWAATQLDDARAAGELASILAVEAAHASTLRTVLEEGLDASFPGGAFEPADIALGFAPEAFPLR